MKVKLDENPIQHETATAGRSGPLTDARAQAAGNPRDRRAGQSIGTQGYDYPTGEAANFES